MQAYEFSAKVGPGGKLVIPDTYTKELPVGDFVRVIVLVHEFSPSRDEAEAPDLLARVVAEIQSTRQNPADVQSTSGLLAEHLINVPHEFDPSFDMTAWNREWDGVEKEIKAIEIADELAEKDFYDR